VVVVRGQGVNLTADLNLTPRISMCGVIFLLRLHALLTWTYNFTFFSIDAGLLCKVNLSVTINFFLTLSCFNFYPVCF
jgi:hypothetical protein